MYDNENIISFIDINTTIEGISMFSCHEENDSIYIGI